MSRQQVQSLAELAGEYRLVVLMLAHTGVRFGELATMTLDLSRHLFGDRLDDVADRMDAGPWEARGLPADLLRTDADSLPLITPAVVA